MKQFEKDDIIDVAFQTATDAELFASQPQAQAKTPEQAAQESEDALRALSEEVMKDPARCFCRNCGQPILKDASVCVHCNYVVNPIALQQGQRLVRARRESYQSRSHVRIRQFITNLTGLDLETPQEKARWTVRKQAYHFETEGAVYCTNCGREVDPGASVCVACNYVLNPLAVQRAQMAVRDRTAKLSRKDLIKSILIPGYGRKMYQMYAQRRPQIALPCRKAGYVNMGLIAVAAVIFLTILSNL